MKVKVTRKQIMNGYSKVYSCGACELYSLIEYNNTPRFYTCGVYGWNADIYTFGDIAIVSGYRPFGKRLENCREYEKQAKGIVNDTSIKYEDKKTMVDKLLEKFLNTL